MLPLVGKEWKYDRRAQYLCLGVLIISVLIVAGAIAAFNFDR